MEGLREESIEALREESIEDSAQIPGGTKRGSLGWIPRGIFKDP